MCVFKHFHLFTIRLLQVLTTLLYLIHCLELPYPQTGPSVKKGSSTLSVLPKRLIPGVTDSYGREENWNLCFMGEPSLHHLKTFQSANLCKKNQNSGPALNAGRLWGMEHAKDRKKKRQLLNICGNASMVHSPEQLWPQPRLFLRIWIRVNTAPTILLLFHQPGTKQNSSFMSLTLQCNSFSSWLRAFEF